MSDQVESEGIKRTYQGDAVPRDDLDKRLLDILYLDSRKKLADIAKHLGVSTASVHNRIKTLEEKGIIKKFTIQIDSEKIGNSLTALVNLQIKVSHLTQVNENLQNIPEIVALYNITGDDDILAICRFRDRQHLNEVLQQILKVDYITKTKTQIALQILKEEQHTPKQKDLSADFSDDFKKFNLLNNY